MINIADDVLEKEFKEFLTQKIEKTRKDLAILESLISGNKLGFSDVPPTNVESLNGYNPKWVWKKKIEYILNQGDATTSEVVDTILKYEPNKFIRGKVVASISAILSVGAKEGGIYTKTLNDRNENVYGLRID